MALQENEKLLTTVNAAATFQQIKADIATKITEAEVEAKGYLTAVPEEYVTDDELTAKGYLTAVPEEYVTDNELSAKGYLTAVPEEYVTEEELTAKGYITAVPEEYVTEEELLAKGYITADQIPPEADLPVATADEILALYTGVNTGETV